MIRRDDIRRELELEAEARQLGAARYRASVPMPWKTESSGAEEQANLPPGRQLIRLAVEPTAQAIREFVETALSGAAGRHHSAVKWLELVDPEEVAYLAARVALNRAAATSEGHAMVQRVAILLGDAIIDHVEYATFKAKNKGGYHGLIKASKKVHRASAKRRAAVKKLLEREDAKQEITTREKLHLGSAVLDMLVAATGLFTIELLPYGKNRKAYIIRPTEAVSVWLDKQHGRSELLAPMLMPMVVRPRRWRSPFTGGYLTRFPGMRLVQNRNKEYQDRLASTDLSAVYAAVNHVQETPWRINQKVMDVLRAVWDTGGSLGGLPPRDNIPVPEKPADAEENAEAMKKWKREAALTHLANTRLQSKRLSLHQRLWVAEKFLDEPAIWFPHSLDFRGRIYPIPAAGLHPQSDDSGKALLEFAHGVPIGPTGGYWLAVHIANLFGVDKVSFTDRVAWTYEHAAEIIDSALAPLDGRRFWTEADSPWMALAAAFEFAEFLDKGESYVSRLPIPLDGSNSGLQHFSALLRDPVGARAVNLVPGDKPQDVYNAVAAEAQAAVDKSLEPGASVWRGKVTRSIAKRPTMTYVYSATRFGMQDMILQTLRETDDERALRGLGPYLDGADNYEAARLLSHIMYDAMAGVVSAASAGMEWLRAVAKVAAKADVALAWTTPDGLPVLQRYSNTYGERVKVHWLGRVVTLMLAVEGTGINTRAQANGIAPNFVHSLDAAHLRAVARGAQSAGIDYLAVIHDSFGTHAGRTDALVSILRNTFVDQYTPDILEQFKLELERSLGVILPDTPARGALSLEQVRRSSYLFA